MLTGVMSLHSVSLLLEAMLLKANSLAELGRVKGIHRFSFVSRLAFSGISTR